MEYVWWTSVEKCLPPFDKEVLVIIKYKEINAHDFQVCRLDSQAYDWIISDVWGDIRQPLTLKVRKDLNAEVTHWMPLPEVPK